MSGKIENCLICGIETESFIKIQHKKSEYSKKEFVKLIGKFGKL